MHISPEIRKFLQNGGKVLIVEDGHPSFVMSDFGSYMQFLGDTDINSVALASKKTYGPMRLEMESLAYPIDEKSVDKTVVDEINRELRDLAKEDFFAPSFVERPETKNPAHRFYREPQ